MTLLAKLDPVTFLVVDLIDTIDFRSHPGYLIAPDAQYLWHWNGTTFEDTPEAQAWRKGQEDQAKEDGQLATSRTRAAAVAADVASHVSALGRTMDELTLRLLVDLIKAQSSQTNLEKQFLQLVADADAAQEPARAVDPLPVAEPSLIAEP